MDLKLKSSGYNHQLNLNDPINQKNIYEYSQLDIYLESKRLLNPLEIPFLSEDEDEGDDHDDLDDCDEGEDENEEHQNEEEDENENYDENENENED